MKQKEMDRLEIVEKYIILLLGIVDKPVPSILHLEKEMFILSRANPTVAKFVSFLKHYKGPYSDVLKELIDSPLYHKDAYKVVNDRIMLTSKGKEIFEKIVKNYEKDKRFRQLLGTLKMIRELYDRLSDEELLLLIYITYPDFREKSNVSDKLLAPEKREEIARKLLKKGLITEKRYREIVEYDAGNT